jgi:hypothetical protein
MLMPCTISQRNEKTIDKPLSKYQYPIPQP